jgi:osmotically-inducible protein OsmY
MMKLPHALMIALLLPLGGCVAAAGGAAGTGFTVTQERSAGEIVDDATVWTRINSHYIQKDVNDLFSHVNIEVHEGRVLLTGNVEAPQTKVEAVRLAWQAEGVKEVINEIEVRNKTSLNDSARDTWLTAQVKSKFLLERNMRSVNYTVETVNGVVYLLGIAQDEDELSIATKIASRVKGVKKVVSHVRLKDDPLRN